MQHFANFGYVRAANKQLKKIHEMQNYETFPLDYGKRKGKSLGAVALNAKNTGDKKMMQDYLLSNKRDVRQGREILKDPLTRPIVSEVRTGEKSPEQLGRDWSDVRKNSDPAINSTYTGFRTDPFKGYGGMMEEAIPIDELYNTKKVRNTTSRLSGLVP